MAAPMLTIPPSAKARVGASLFSREGDDLTGFPKPPLVYREEFGPGSP
ncbi:MAG: hypothetical protein CM1200mP22_28810 [Dehalococcoidia bacterium]|nr:MAG: hypothetical protein CM1200mP22_28810 [Dehalococcoidia bacterium]